MSVAGPEKWVVCRRPKPDASLRLICAAWAGGNASVFNKWPDSLPDAVEVRALQLPGRMSRSKEECLTSIPDMVDGIAKAVTAMELLGKPFALFGHSMGALVVYELARKLAQDNGVKPILLVVSACRPPNMSVGGLGPPVSQLPRDEFVDHLVCLGGMPAELRDQRELLDHFLPPIRTDYMALECYQPDLESTPLACPMVCLGGAEDSGAVRADLAQWANFTTEEFRLRTFAGGHFFLKNQGQATVLEYLSELLVRR